MWEEVEAPTKRLYEGTTCRGKTDVQESKGMQWGKRGAIDQQ